MKSDEEGGKKSIIKKTLPTIKNMSTAQKKPLK
jgi:hypothetical protein